MNREEKIKDARKWKDVLAKVWLLSVAGAIIIGVYGWLSNDMSMVGMAFAYFMLFSILFIALFSTYDEREEELEEEKRKEELENRIEKLESEVF